MLEGKFCQLETIDIHKILHDIYDMTSSANVKYIIQKELTGTHENNDTKEKYADLRESKWINHVLEEQNQYGNWGRFHSSNSKLKRKYPTTEYALKYLYLLGLERGHEAIDDACSYMEFLINNREMWPDSWEKNKWFDAGVDLFITSSLARFGSDDSCYNHILSGWIEVLDHSFKSGEYSTEDCNDASKKILGVGIHDSYIGLNSIKAIVLFAFNEEKISLELKKKYLTWLKTYPKNIFYMSIDLSCCHLDDLNATETTDWLILMDLLSKFEGYSSVYHKEINHLLSRKTSDDLWDFGKALSKFKISDSWRSEKDRLIDQSVYVLRILSNMKFQGK